MAHTCQALILACMDFRFIDSIQEFAKEEGLLANYDYIALAGSSKDIVDNGENSIIIDQIGISARLHEICKVYLIHHEDCGGYGGKKSFASDDEELSKHKDHLQIAQETINKKFPDLEVIKVFAHIKEEDGKNVISFEKI